MGPNLKIEFNEANDGDSFQVIMFEGDFDKAGYSEISAKLNAFVKEFKLNKLIFDFSKMKFINSEGIGYLMEIHTHLLKNDQHLILVGPNDHVKDVFNTIGIDEVIPVEKTLAEAIK